MKNSILTLLMVLATTLLSCNNNGSYDVSSPDAALEKSFTESNTNLAEDENSRQIDRKIIKEGNISFETSDINETRILISKTVKELNGYISDDNAYDYNDRTEQSLSIRVPANNFDSLLNKISQFAKKIDSKNVNTQDVTEEFIDIEARLKNKKELETRYLELLKQARNVDEILSIEKEINTLRSDIDAIEGRLKYLKSRVSYSTLRVDFYEKKIPDFGFGSKIGQAIVNGWSNLLGFLIAMLSLWPFILVAIGTIFFYKRYRKNRKNRQ
ncbi:MAG: DUF4349 domain-containing protein [Bacteroidetes bacterium]|nr:DUF4349 domain-containing protein [Bacteroidota bacterium]